MFGKSKPTDRSLARFAEKVDSFPLFEKRNEKGITSWERAGKSAKDDHRSAGQLGSEMTTWRHLQVWFLFSAQPRISFLGWTLKMWFVWCLFRNREAHVRRKTRNERHLDTLSRFDMQVLKWEILWKGNVFFQPASRFSEAFPSSILLSLRRRLAKEEAAQMYTHLLIPLFVIIIHIYIGFGRAQRRRWRNKTV